MNGPKGIEGAGVSKVERALNEEPKISRREDFKKPGSWASEMLRIALTGYEDERRELTAIAIKYQKEKRLTNAEVAEFSRWKNLRKLIANQGSPDRPWEYTDFAPSIATMRKLEAAMPSQLTEKVKKGRRKYDNPLIDSVPLTATHDYTLPPALLSWSRKVYATTPEMQKTLLDLDYSKALWSDALMPHGTFVIELASPIPLAHQDSHVSEALTCAQSLIVMNGIIDGKSKIWVVPLLSQHPFIARESFSKSAREMLEEAAKGEKQYSRAIELIASMSKRMTESPNHAPEQWTEEKKAQSFFDVPKGSYKTSTFSLLDAIDIDEPILDPNAHETLNMIRKVIAGTCTYLSARAPGAGGEGTGEEPLPAEPRGPTDPEEVLLVEGASMGLGSAEVVKVLQRELKRRKAPIPHKRRAHDRTLPNGKVIRIEEMEIGTLRKGEQYRGSTTKLD